MSVECNGERVVKDIAQGFCLDNWLAGSLRRRGITRGEGGLEGRRFNFGSVKF